jgi:hypothetical protein
MKEIVVVADHFPLFIFYPDLKRINQLLYLTVPP